MQLLRFYGLPGASQALGYSQYVLTERSNVDRDKHVEVEMMQNVIPSCCSCTADWVQATKLDSLQSIAEIYRGDDVVEKSC
jgi:hypothetical protein